MNEKNVNKNLDETKFCPFCNEEIPIQAVKCMHCAKWIDMEDKKVEDPLARKTPKICLICGTKNPNYSNFCGNCGKKLDLKEPYDENKLEEESIVKLCPYCDSEVNYNALKCKYCGEWIEKKRDFNEITKPAKDTIISESIREGIKYLKEFNKWR